MKIKKLNGSLQSFMPNKILNRLKIQSKGLNVNPDLIFKESVSGVYDGMSTTDIDLLLAKTAANKIVDHFDYSYLASRIAITRQSKLIGVEPMDSDFLYDYIGIQSFFFKYSMRDDNENPIELPHMMYKRVAKFLECDKYFDDLRYKKISVATPILINSGKQGGSLISCNITTLEEDSTQGILSTLNDISNASRDGAGIGLHIHNLRSKHSIVSSFKGKAGGVVRFADMVQSHMRFFKQGNRSGSAALYLGIWHRDVEDFLHLRLQIGEDRMRTRDLFTSICIPDLFMEKLNSDDDEWYLFCPNDIEKLGGKQLHDTWGQEFKDLYQKYIEAGIGHKTSVKKLWKMILTSQAEAGLPYTFFWDNANKQNPQSNIGIIRGYNLCAEFAGVSNPKYTSQCDLGLIPLHNIEKNDFKEVANRVKKLVTILNKVIDKNNWSTKAAEKAGNHQRAIGIGIAGLADYFAIHKISFESHEAKEFNDKLMETIYSAAKKQSSHLAEKVYKKSYPAWKGSQYEKEGVPMANSLLLCLMPSASTSALLGINEMFEAFYSNVFLRRLDVGEFLIINKYLQGELMELGIWNDNIKNKIIANEGKIQTITEIPEDIRYRYKTIFEIKQKVFIDLAAIRQKHIDQGQSMNLYFEQATTAKMGGALNYAWKEGLPTGSYYVRTVNILNNLSRLAVDKTQEIATTTKVLDNGHEVQCFGCSS